MALAHCVFDATNENTGALLSNVLVEVRLESSGALVECHSDRDGTVSLGTSFTVSDGRVSFFAVGGAYKITLTAPGHSRILRYVANGTSAETDVGVVNFAGYTYTFETGTSAPPSTASIRADDADLTAATEFYIDDDTLAGNDISAILLALGPASGNTKNQLRLTDPANGAQLTADITGVTDNTDYVTLAVSGNVGATSMSVGSVKLDFILAGARGATGPEGLLWNGAWVTATAYAVDDAVENDGSSYICISAHTSGDLDDEPGVGAVYATYWELVASQGSVGPASVITGTSTTSVAIGTGSKGPFTTQAGVGWVVGTRVRLASAANVANYMEGAVSAYSGTDLTVTVDQIGGSGTLNDWNISIAGMPGAGSGDLVGPSDSAANEIALFDGATGKLLKRPSTGAGIVPVGTQAQRPTGAKGMLRFNDDTDQFEGYDGVAWSQIGGAASTDQFRHDAAQVLEIAALGSGLLGFPNGFVDAFNSEDGVDADATDNMTYDATNDWYSPSSTMGGIDSDTKLMLHCDGSDESTTLTDSASGAKTVTVNGNAQIDTAQSKFGGASLLLDGSGDYLQVANDADLRFGTDDFTVDLWARWNSTSGDQMLVGMGNANNGDEWWLIFKGTAVTFENNGIARVSASFTPTLNTWYHIALVRESGTFTVYVDGVSLGTYTGTINLSESSAALDIGSYVGGSRYFNGWLDEVRITNGVARWSSDFTPPTGPYSSVASIQNGTLVLSAVTAAATPDTGRLISQIIANESITINTDVKSWVSRAEAAFTTDYASDTNQLDDTAHGLANDDRILLKTTDTLPAGLSKGTIYFVVNATTDAFELATTSSGTPITVTDDGTGTHGWICVTEATLEDANAPINNYTLYADDEIDVSAQPSGTTMRAIVQILGKDVDMTGFGLFWE